MFEHLNRRGFLNLSAVSSIGLIAGYAKADVPAGRDPFDYEVTRTEGEWRAMLSDAEFSVLRDGRTERQRTSPLWRETRDGTYACMGCELPQYSSFTKVFPGKGWVFFTASEPNSQLMSQDSRAEMTDDFAPTDIHIEVHCRRCGSHMGHILLVDGALLHCINGTSLRFAPSA